MPTKYPSVVPERLSRYLRALEKMKPADFVCSSVLARLTGVSPAQVRKDLAYFGQFGRRGKGYEVESLRRKLREILGIDRTWKVVLVGVGNLMPGETGLLPDPGNMRSLWVSSWRSW